LKINGKSFKWRTVHTLFTKIWPKDPPTLKALQNFFLAHVAAPGTSTANDSMILLAKACEDADLQHHGNVPPPPPPTQVTVQHEENADADDSDAYADDSDADDWDADADDVDVADADDADADADDADDAFRASARPLFEEHELENLLNEC
jgi:hypothetical protein